MTPLRVAMIVFLAASIQAQPLDVLPSAAQLREWVDDGCVRSGKRVGIDYPGALERAIRSTLPAGYEVRKPGARGEENQRMLRAFRWNLLVLSYVSLVVGAVKRVEEWGAP